MEKLGIPKSMHFYHAFNITIGDSLFNGETNKFDFLITKVIFEIDISKEESDKDSEERLNHQKRLLTSISEEKEGRTYSCRKQIIALSFTRKFYVDESTTINSLFCSCRHEKTDFIFVNDKGKKISYKEYFFDKIKTSENEVIDIPDMWSKIIRNTL